MYDEDEKHDSEDVYPQTYIVIEFSKSIRSKTLSWIIDKMISKRRHGGAELLVRKQPYSDDQGVVIHVSASETKLLEVAEEMALVKADKAGNRRELVVEQMEELLPDLDDLLSTADRQRIVKRELDKIRALPEDRSVPGCAEIQLYPGQSLMQVLENLGFIARMHPLHDAEHLKKLGKEWYRALFTKQPIEEIREYFGEAVALYFNFLGFYTWALLIPMSLGFLQLAVPQATLAFFCVFNVIWVTVFLETWKRRCSELAFNWGTIGMSSLDEPRPNYHGKMGVDAITGKLQPQYPRWKTNLKMYCVSIPIVLMCLVIAFFVMLSSFWFEDIIKSSQTADSNPYVIFIPGIVYTGIVYVSNVYYRKFATALTEWENHRTQSQFERHRVLKLVLFEFVNNFMSLFYIAFCLRDLEMLRQQLAMMLVVLQAFSHLEEAFLPVAVRCCQNKLCNLMDWHSNKHTRVEEQTQAMHELTTVKELSSHDPRVQEADEQGELDGYEGTYDDYLELFVQFGYVVLFSSAYPLAAFWAVVNNVLEIRADAFKLCKVFRRPMAKKVKDIGAWQVAFEALGAISIMTNCALLSISPEMQRVRVGMKLEPLEWFMMFICLEHVLIAVRHVLHKAIPERPEWVRIALAKTDYESQRALKNEKRQKSHQMLTRRFKTVHGRHGKH